MSSGDPCAVCGGLGHLWGCWNCLRRRTDDKEQYTQVIYGNTGKLRPYAPADTKPESGPSEVLEPAGGVDQGMPRLLGTQVGGEHYKNLSPQPIEVIEAWDLGFHLGAALKYIARAGRKPGNSAKQDIEKAVWFLQRYAETLN